MKEKFYEIVYNVEKSHWWFRGRKKIILDLISELVLPTKGILLDVGCGTGAILEAFSRKYEAIGLDSSKLAVKFCRERGLSNVYQGELADLSLPKEKIRLITLLDVLEHIEDDIATLKTCFDKLKSNGYLIITVPAYMFLWTGHDTAGMHKRRYTKKTLRKVVVDAGFEIRKISYYNTFLFPLMALSRLSERVLGAKRYEERLTIPSTVINNLFELIFRFERHFLKQLSFPFGGSLICIGQKPER